MNAVIYARYSSHNQREESIEGQLRECHAYAKRNNMTVVGEYIDRAISGRTDDRADFQRMIRDSEKGHFQAIITYTLDRFARNRYDSAMYKYKLKRNGVRVLYAKQYIPDEPEGIILESVLEGYAEYYSENLSRNIKRGMRENALACKVTGGTTPLGYAIGPDHTYVIDPAGAKIVQEIFQLYADGWSAGRIIDYCNQRGYRTATNSKFNKNSLRPILTNIKYTGVYKYGDIVQEGGMPVIIPRELFDQVQAMFKHNFVARAKGKAREDYLLTTKLFCGHCGSLMIGDSGTAKNGSIYRYYKCASRKRDPSSCDKHQERKEWIEELVVRHTLQILMTDESIDRIAEKAAQIIEKESSANNIIPALESELADVSSRLTNLMKAVEKGLDPELVTDRIQELTAQKKDLETRIAIEQTKEPFLTKDRIAFWLMSFRKGDISDESFRRRVIDSFVNSIYVFDIGGNGRRIVFTFNVSDYKTSTLTLSDIECFAPPLRAYPNPFFWKHVFGFVLEIEDIG